MIVGGFDPGGRNSGGSGVALILWNKSAHAMARTTTVFSVMDAITWIKTNHQSFINGFGIDTLLSWSVYESGWRPMDWYIKHHYPIVQNSVVPPNFLQGSMTLQGMSMAISLRQMYSDILLNETHPKVQYYALTGNRYNYDNNKASMDAWLLSNIGVTTTISNEHEWDALFSAWATYMGMIGRWSYNLIKPYGNLVMPVGQTYYYWS